MKTLDILPCAATPIILFLLLFFTHVKLEQGFEIKCLKVGDASTEGSIIKEFNTVVKNPQVL